MSNHSHKLYLWLHGNNSASRGVAFTFSQKQGVPVTLFSASLHSLGPLILCVWVPGGRKWQNHRGCDFFLCRQDGSRAPRVWAGWTEAGSSGVEGGEFQPGACSWESSWGVLHWWRLSHPKHHQAALRGSAIRPPLLAGWVKLGKRKILFTFLKLFFSVFSYELQQEEHILAAEWLL